MRGKEFAKSILLSFFIIVTLINIATSVLGMIFVPEARFGYEAFLSPLVYGLFSLIPYIVMYSRKELTVKELVIRKILQLISIELILLFIAFGFSGIQSSDYGIIFGFTFSILVIYLLVHVINWILDMKTAEKMNVDLQNYQNHVTD
ncbi:MAG: hypothetical protein GX567_18935 [Clostridia bacterium]|nr:hypothetical protein [Clostridia bacterium]